MDQITQKNNNWMNIVQVSLKKKHLYKKIINFFEKKWCSIKACLAFKPYAEAI